MFRERLGRVRGLRLAIAFVGVVLSACGPFDGSWEPSNVDPTLRLGAVTWVAQATVGSQSGFLGRRTLTLRIDQVIDQEDVNSWFDVRHQTPDLPTGERIEAVIENSSERVEVEGRPVIAFIQPAAEPGELEDGGYSIVLLMDRTWVPIQAADDALDAYVEILAMTGQPAEVESMRMLRDAREGALLERMVAEQQKELRDKLRTGEIGQPKTDEEVAALKARYPLANSDPYTPGMFGEWRRQRGYEPQLPRSYTSAALAQWLALSPEERPIGLIREEIPIGASEALGLQGWDSFTVEFEPSPEFLAEYQAVAVRFEDVGLVGPFGLDPSSPVLRFSGFGPAGRDVVAGVVAWPHSDRPRLREGILLFEVSIPELAVATVTSEGFRFQISR